MAVSTEDAIVANMNKSPNQPMKPTAPIQNRFSVNLLRNPLRVESKAAAAFREEPPVPFTLNLIQNLQHKIVNNN